MIENKSHINDMVYLTLEKGKVVLWNKSYISDISRTCVIWDTSYICNRIGWEINLDVHFNLLCLFHTIVNYVHCFVMND